MDPFASIRKVAYAPGFLFSLRAFYTRRPQTVKLRNWTEQGLYWRRSIRFSTVGRMNVAINSHALMQRGFVGE